MNDNYVAEYIERTISSYVDNSIVTIPSYAFAGASKLGTVSVANCETIGKYAFASCSPLDNLYFPKVSSISEYTYMFNMANVKQITNKEFPKLSIITYGAFGRIYNIDLVDLPLVISASSGLGFTETYTVSVNTIRLNGLYYIQSSALANMLVNNVEFKNAVAIGNSAFEYCRFLTSVSLPKVNTIGSRAFYECSRIYNILFPEAYVIYDSAFAYCSNLTEVSFPKAVYIGSKAFYNCSRISFINNSTITAIGGDAFEYCSGITEIDLNNIGYVGSSAFKYCYGLSKVMMPNANTIDQSAFCYCYSLQDIYAPKASLISSRAFQDCNSLSCVSFYSKVFKNSYISNNIYDSIRTSASIISDISRPSISCVLSSLNDGFYGTGIEYAYIPEVSSIGGDAFRNCSKLKSIFAPNLTAIGNAAFENCYSLSNVTFPKLSSIESYTFENCGLKNAIFENATIVSDFAFARCMSLETVEAKNASIIGKGAFASCYKLKTVHMPKVKMICSSAFSSCLSLSMVNFPECESLSYGAFRNCPNLKSVIFEGLSSMPSKAFISTGIEMARFDNLIKIGNVAFASMSELKTVYIPKVTQVGSGAFEYCSNLRDLYADSMEYIYDGAFEWCSGLRYIKLPNVLMISYGAFALNNSPYSTDKAFPKLMIGSLVRAIHSSAFKGFFDTVYFESGISTYAFQNPEYIGDIQIINELHVASMYTPGFCFYLKQALYRRSVYGISNKLKIFTDPEVRSLYANALSSCMSYVDIYP